ncbi:MAG: ABC transporter substrate-binding protein [Microbacterium sp.]
MTQHRRSRLLRAGILAVTTASALTLAGCSGTGGDTEATQEDTNEFSLAFPVDNDVTTAYETLAEQYMDENPDVTITINGLPGETYAQTIRTQLQAGNASDVFVTSPGTGQVYSVVTLAEAGLLAPLGDTATSLIPAGSESQFIVEDETYGQALDIAFVGNIFNDMSGVTYPTDLSGLLSTCEDLAADGQSLFVVAGSVAASPAIMALTVAATRVYAEDPEWNDERLAGEVTFADSEGWKETLETISQMYDAGCFQDGVEGAGYDAITEELTAGTALSMFGPSSVATEINTAAQGYANFVIEAFPAESASDQQFAYASANYSYSIAAGSKNKVAAQEFLDWMAEPEQSKAFADGRGSLPVSGIEDLDLSETIYAPVADLLTSGDYMPVPNSSWPEAAVFDALGAGVQGLFTGQKTVDQVLQELDTAWG